MWWGGLVPRIPSVKTLEGLCKAYRLDNPTQSAKDIRKAMEGAHNAPTPPWRAFWGIHYENAMRAIDGILGTCGVEYVHKGRNTKSPSFSYCNTGDSYGVTVILTWHRGHFGQEWAVFSVGSWADRVERGNYE